MDSRAARARSRRVADALAAVRRRVLRRRRLVAVVLLGVAVAAALRSVSPPPPPTAAVLVAARDLPAGATLRAGDLVAAELPRDSVPDGAADAPVGRLLAAPLRRGEPVTDVRLVGAGLAATTSDEEAVPVRLSDAGQAALLTAGDRIDLLATDPQAGTTRPVAHEVTVLAVPDAADAADGALPGRLVVLGVRPSDVHDVTGAAVTSFVTFTWCRS